MTKSSSMLGLNNVPSLATNKGGFFPSTTNTISD